MPERPFADFLDESFAALRAEVPGIHAEMCRRLAPREVELVVDDERIAIAFSREGAAFLGESRRPAIAVRTKGRAILDLIDALATLREAVLDERLELRGAPDDLLAFHEGLMAYLHGGVRAPSFPRLLRDFRRRQVAAPVACDDRRPAPMPSSGRTAEPREDR
ncbi:MAG TPA: hypothetical protein VEI94_07255 [Candidatus Bathyarchaeia archaeon]|nr:hypothetical protein [Candidatus Bathyarchaeia archaeon]